MRRIGLLFVAASLMLPARARADETTLEYWPEIHIWVQLPQHVRLASYITMSRNIETGNSVGSFRLQADYVWKRRHSRYPLARLADEVKAAEMRPYMLRAGFLAGRSLGDNEADYSERSGLVEFHIRVPLRGGILLSHRVRTDLRFLGDAPDFSWRFRYRLKAEKEFLALGTSFVPFVSAEPYYDSRPSAINRLACVGGATAALFGRLDIEANVTYQLDPRTSTAKLAALNTILSVFF